MIDKVDQQLQAWVAGVLDDVAVSFAPPPQQEGISLYLMSLNDAPPMRTRLVAPLQVSLHYLVTCWGDDLLRVHAQLSTLLFSAMEHAEYDVIFEPINSHLWQTFDIPPQPGFILAAKAYRERPEPVTPRVQEPRFETVPAVPLQGAVYGPNDVPIAGAYVQLPLLQLSQQTDNHGKFYFPNVPGDSVQVLVRAKGVERRITVDRQDDKEPLAVRFDTFN